MIEYKITDDGKHNLLAKGSEEEIFAGTVVMIRKIYDNLKKHDAEAAERYREGVAIVLIDTDGPFFAEVLE